MNIKDVVATKILPKAVKSFKRYGDLAPGGILLAADGRILEAYQLDFADARNKDVSIAYLRAAAERLDAHGVVICAESWVMAADHIATPEELARIDQVGLHASGVPHYEALTFMGESTTDGVVAGEARITRTETGKPQLGELQWKDIPSGPGTSLRGRMMNILPRRTPLQ